MNVKAPGQIIKHNLKFWKHDEKVNIQNSAAHWCVCVVGPFTRIEITDAIVPCHKPTNKSMALSKTFHVIRSDEGMALANVHTHARRRTIFAHKVNWLVFRFSKHCEVSL